MASEPTRFVGRESDLAAISQIYAAGARLVTLVGAPGVGKTRLAKQYGARALAEGTVGDVFFCDVSGARSAEQILAALGAAIEVSLAAGATAAEAARRLAHALAALDGALVIFDNFEPVVDHAGATLGVWLTQAPGATFLVTSRERLRVAGEACLAAEPLPEDDAAELFVDRARLVLRSFRCEGEDHDALRELLRRLDHNPLAIELAAARVEVLPPAGLLARISARLDLLRSRSRDAVARHATLRAAIDWSWDLLPAAERDALARCSVFEGGFTIEAAEAVLAPPDPHRAVELVEALLARSLLYRCDTAGVRFGLYESIREYAAERLAEEGAVAGEAEARHAAHHLDEAERISARALLPWVGGAVPALMRELDNLRAVLRHSVGRDAKLAARAALCLEVILAARGPAGARLAVLEDASRAPTGDAALDLRLLWARGSARRLVGPLAAARADLERAAELARSAGRPEIEALALKSLAEVAIDAGATRDALALLDRLLEIARDPRAGLDRRIEGLALHLVARVHFEMGDLLRALALGEEALSIVGRLGPRSVEGRLLCLLSDIHQRRGHHDDAERDLLASLEIARDLGDSELETIALGHLGMVHADRGRYDAAGAHFAEALALTGRLGYPRIHTFLLCSAGMLAHLRGDFAGARGVYRKGLAVFREVGARRAEAIVLELQSVLDLEEGRLDDAASATSRALEVAAELRQPALDIVLGTFAGVVLAERGRVDEASEIVRSARTLVQAIGRPELALGLDLTAALVEIRRAEAAGRAPRAEVARAEERLAAARAASSASLQVRLLVRAVAGAIPRGDPGPSPLSDALRIGPEARWFEVGGGGRVDLSRRGALRRLLLRLAGERASAPDRSVSFDALVEAGWPSSRGTRDSMQRRLYTSLWMLRDLGLRDVLLRRDDGYLLDPAVRLVFPG